MVEVFNPNNFLAISSFSSVMATLNLIPEMDHSKESSCQQYDKNTRSDNYGVLEL